MYKNNNDEFIEASKRERFHFKMFVDKYNLFNEDDGYTTLITPVEGMDRYDALIQKYESDTYMVEKRYIVELKVRMLSDDKIKRSREEGWILESKKLNDLKEIQELDPDNNDILYICFNNRYTMVWNITKMINNGKIGKTIKMDMNKATMDSRSNKINKNVYLLKEEDGKRYEYTACEQSYLRNINKKNELKEGRKKDTLDMSKCLFNILNRK